MTPGTPAAEASLDDTAEAFPAAGHPRRGIDWTSSTLGTLAYTLFAVQQPGPVADLRTQDQARAEGIISPAGAVTPPGTDDLFLRRQNVLGEISQLDL